MLLLLELLLGLLLRLLLGGSCYWLVRVVDTVDVEIVLGIVVGISNMVIGGIGVVGILLE